MADASGTARLAGHRVHPHRLEREADAEADCDVRHLPPLVARQPGTVSGRSRKPPARPRPALPVRDSSLFISGLLVEREGGQSVRPYQPEGVWEAVAFQGSNTRQFKQDDGANLYRRSMYTFWKRTSPPPSMLTFDAPSRENCTVRRSRTNTPLQSLALMNDVQYFEAARKFAERMLKDGGDQPTDRLEWGFRVATGRVPSSHEREILRKVFDEQLARYTAQPATAEELLKVGLAPRNQESNPVELAAYTMLGNLLLNLDEVVTKE
jgi:Protein of unknown function (DUF1553)